MSWDWARISLLAALAVFAFTEARAADATPQARFAAFRAAHPNPDAEIARIKTRTAALIAAAPPFDTNAPTDRPPMIWRASDRHVALWDGAALPEMIVVPAGEYAMGSPAAEANREPREDLRHRVRIAYSFAVGKFSITVGQFAHFVAATGYDAGDWCHTDEAGAQPRTGRNWRTPGFAQSDDNPVVCVSSVDAQAYADWLSKTTGHRYRLMSEAEYEYVNRAGTMSAFWWGDDADAACAYANGPDMDTKAVFPTWAANNCRDGYAFTAPVGRFKPNAFGLYDTTGNAWSWLADCYNESYAGAPRDGAANLSGDCKWHVLRGGAWGRVVTYLRSAKRGKDLLANRIYNNSFRVARTL